MCFDDVTPARIETQGYCQKVRVKTMSCNPAPLVFFGDRPRCPVGQRRKRKLGKYPSADGSTWCWRYQTGPGNSEESNGVVVVADKCMMAGVTSWYAPPAMLTKLNCRDICVDIPVEKHANSSRMYSLKVAPRHRPIFWISRSEYPERERALAPPLRRECVSIRWIGIPFSAG